LGRILFGFMDCFLAMRRATLAALFLSAPGASAGSTCFESKAALAAPSSVGCVWDLDTVYPDEISWRADRGRVLEGIAAAAGLRGQTRRSARELARVLDVVHELRGRAGKMARFAVLQSALDAGSAVNRARLEEATALEARVEQTVSFLAGEVAALGRARIAAWEAREPRLFPHRLRLDQILVQSAHSASPPIEALLSADARIALLPDDTADSLMEADLGWTAIRAGEPPVDPGRFDGLRRSPDGAVRKDASAAFFARLRAFEATFGLLAARRIESDLAVARARAFANGIDAQLARSDDVPPGLLPRIIEAQHAHADIGRRFAALLKRIRGEAALSYGDLRFLPVPFERRITVSESREIILGAVAPLGAEYAARMRQRLDQPWMHLAPAPHKSGNVGVWWAVGGGHPYALLTYTDDLASSRLFAGGAMLMMDYADLPAGFTPDLRSEDQPIHGNTIWSTARLLHDDHLLSKISDRRERIALLVDHLRFLWRAFQANLLLVEVEHKIAERIKAAQPVTGEGISALFLEQAKAMVGNVAIEPLEWIIHPNGGLFARNHPVFVLSAAAAAALAERVAAGDARAIAGLGAGLSQAKSLFSYKLLKAMNVDLLDSWVQEAVFRRMSARLDLLEKALDAP
jgi:oligoendopeptidase F